jgi:hypothetical protein
MQAARLVATKVDGREAGFCFDTGVSLSAMSDSEA